MKPTEPTNPRPMRRMRRGAGELVTLKDVAQLAGVSRMTVSVVLNGAGRDVPVAEGTRRKIVEAAAQLGYIANGAAKATATGRFGNVALLLSSKDFVSSLPVRLLEGITDELSERNYCLSLFRLPDAELTDEIRIPKVLREWMADGMIIDYTHDIPAKMVDLVEANRLPAIWCNTKRDSNCVRPDDYLAGKQAAQLVLSHGHQKIAYLDYANFNDPGGVPVEHYSAGDRLRGAEDEVRAAGAEIITDFRKAEGASFFKTANSKRVRELILHGGITAAICYGGEYEAVLMACASLGLEVPRDLSIITFAEGLVYRMEQLITTIEIPHYRVGRTSVRLLLDRIDHPGVNHDSAVLPFELHEASRSYSVTTPRQARSA